MGSWPSRLWESRCTWTRKLLRWRGPASVVNYRSIPPPIRKNVT
jgi:hypothetical protein